MKPNTESERHRLGGLLEKLRGDLAVLRSDGGPARCAECPNDCVARIEGEIEQGQARLRELNENQNDGGAK